MEGFLPKKPSRRVWFAEQRNYAMGRARTQARRAKDRPAVLTCELNLGRLRAQFGKKKVFHRNGVIAIDGKLLSSFATVTRIKRDNGAGLTGYQRPEVVSHIGEIKAYLESETPMIPNAVVVAFDTRVRFEPGLGFGAATDYAQPGTLVIPVDKRLPDQEKPGFVVDGQQRLAAIRDARIKSFPICVSAFITD